MLVYGTNDLCPKIPATPVTPVNALVEPVEGDVDSVWAVLRKQSARLPIYLSFRAPARSIFSRSQQHHHRNPASLPVIINY